MTENNHLFLSPHLDDAVLSCGGTIHQLVARGDSVTVMTLMAGDPPDMLLNTPIVRDLHQRWQAGYSPVETRRQEDIAAVTHLGAHPRHFMLADCVYRFGWTAHKKQAFYPTEETLWGQIHPDDPARITLESLYIAPGATVYFPLGVGRHVDHLIVRDWALSLDKQLARIGYAEYPYSQQDDAIEAALMALDSCYLEPEPRYLEARDVQAKIDAIACYGSQLSTFWESRGAMAAEVRAALNKAGNGRPAERFWRLV